MGPELNHKIESHMFLRLSQPGAESLPIFNNPESYF